MKTNSETHGRNEDGDGALFCVDDDRVVVLQEGDGAALLCLRGDVPDDKPGEIHKITVKREGGRDSTQNQVLRIVETTSGRCFGRLQKVTLE